MKFQRLLPLISGLVLILFTGLSVATAAQIFDIEGPSAGEVDSAPTAPTVLNFNANESGIINSISVRIHFYDTQDASTYWDNMFVQISHLGTDVILMNLQTDIFGSGDTLIATFKDGGADLASSGVTAGLTEGTFAPMESLSTFNGMPLGGQWTLTMYDNAGYADDGTDLISSSIFGHKNADVAVPGLSVSGLSMLILLMLTAGFLLLRRKA